ncbi:hypothetical protein PR202_ga07525 [Eleusine coracana subsp. coracana]|uniref:SET domain-containing protein n=1 Tax=Eleusine coracana subsp. coracana TaxID=191504 RepID=A0AAV5BY88_ELECO|nr:hypothetical protein PR202_ga07525 [Eleusine coracana subsp. coracana]
MGPACRRAIPTTLQQKREGKLEGWEEGESRPPPGGRAVGSSKPPRRRELQATASSGAPSHRAARSSKPSDLERGEGGLNSSHGATGSWRKRTVPPDLERGGGLAVRHGSWAQIKIAGSLGPSPEPKDTSLGFKADVIHHLLLRTLLSMERLKSAVPAELRQAVGEGTAANLPATTSRLLGFFDGLPLFHQIMREITDPELALCRKDKGRAVELKGQGNACFSRREFRQALVFYSQALRNVPINSDQMDVNLVAAIYVNRASAMHAWYRRGMVNASLKKYSSAVHDLESALSMEVTTSGKDNIKQELKLILQKHGNMIEAGASNGDRKDAELLHTGQLNKVVLECIPTPDKGRGMASPNDISPASLIHVEEPLAALVLLICQIKVNSIAIVRMKSMDRGHELIMNGELAAANGAALCSMEQVRVAQAIYISGSLFNHSCQPNVHAYFLSRALVLRSTEFIESGSPIELSYGPQVGEMDLPERQRLLRDNYYFSCQCSSCSELNLSDLVVNSLRCPQSNCLGALSESSNYSIKENFAHVSLNESRVCKLSLPDVSKVDEDLEKVGKSFFQHSGICLNIECGCCMSCSSHVDVSYAVARSCRLTSKINRLKELTVVDNSLITGALQSLKQLKKLRHPYSRILAQVEDTIAEAFAKVGDQEQARKHCEASIQILEKLYHSKHIIIAHELIKLVSILLSMGDEVSAVAAFLRAEAIFLLYYGSDVKKILPYVDALRGTISDGSIRAP